MFSARTLVRHALVLFLSAFPFRSRSVAFAGRLAIMASEVACINIDGITPAGVFIGGRVCVWYLVVRFDHNCMNVWVVTAPLYMPKLQISGFFRHFSCRSSGNDRKISGICGYGMDCAAGTTPMIITKWPLPVARWMAGEGWEVVCGEPGMQGCAKVVSR